jgi:hypothetical protein
LSLTCTGFTGTLAMSQDLTSAGSVTLAAAMTINGSAQLIVSAAATLTSNGKTWPTALRLNSSLTFTLADNWDIDGVLTIGHANGGVTINGFQINAGGGAAKATQNGVISGTTAFVFDGPGTWSIDTTGGSWNIPTTINLAGTLNIGGAANQLNLGTATLTYTAGTVVPAANHTLALTAAITLDTNGISWINFTSTANTNYTVTLTSDLTVTGLATIGAGTRTHTYNTGTLKLSGGLRWNGTSGTLTGTSPIHLLATQTVDASASTTAMILSPIVINNSGATITFDATNCPLIDLDNLTLTAFTALVIDGVTLSSGGGGGTTIAGTPMMRGMV